MRLLALKRQKQNKTFDEKKKSAELESGVAKLSVDSQVQLGDFETWRAFLQTYLRSRKWSLPRGAGPEGSSSCSASQVVNVPAWACCYCRFSASNMGRQGGREINNHAHCFFSSYGWNLELCDCLLWRVTAPGVAVGAGDRLHREALGGAQHLFSFWRLLNCSCCFPELFQENIHMTYMCISFLFFYCVVDLQCCMSFCCTAKWFSVYCTCVYSFSYSFGLWFLTGYWIGSLGSAVGPCLSILCVIVCICSSQTPDLSLPWQPQVCPLYLWVCFCFWKQKIYLYHILDSMYKWCHVIFFCFWLISLSMIISVSFHIAANGTISSFLWLSSIPSHTHTHTHTHTHLYIPAFLYSFLRGWMGHCLFILHGSGYRQEKFPGLVSVHSRHLPSPWKVHPHLFRRLTHSAWESCPAPRLH